MTVDAVSIGSTTGELRSVRTTFFARLESDTVTKRNDDSGTSATAGGRLWDVRHDSRVYVFTQSPVRLHRLGVLYEEENHQIRDRKDRLTASRVTVHRNIDALFERDWIETSDRECTITMVGKLVVSDPTIRTRRQTGISAECRPPIGFDVCTRQLASNRCASPASASGGRTERIW